MILRLAIVLLAYATLARADVPIPTIEGPVTGGKGSPFVEKTTFGVPQRPDVGRVLEREPRLRREPRFA